MFSMKNINWTFYFSGKTAKSLARCKIYPHLILETRKMFLSPRGKSWFWPAQWNKSERKKFERKSPKFGFKLILNWKRLENLNHQILLRAKYSSKCDCCKLSTCFRTTLLFYGTFSAMYGSLRYRNYSSLELKNLLDHQEKGMTSLTHWVYYTHL